MILKDFYKYYFYQTAPNQTDKITGLLINHFPTVASLVPVYDYNKELMRYIFHFKYKSLEVKKDLYNVIKILTPEEASQNSEFQNLLSMIISGAFVKEYEKYCHLAMQAGLVYNSTGKHEDYKYSSIQNYNIKSNKSVSEVYGNQKDSTTHGDDVRTSSFGERSTTQSNTDNTEINNTMNNGATNTSNYETSMENETPKLFSKATSDAIANTTNSTTKGSGSVNEVEKAHENTDTSKYGDVVNTKDGYTNTFSETYEEIGDKSLRPTAEVILSEVNTANYTRFLDTVYSDCILALCETTVW